MNKAVFLDRDGVINMERGEYTWKPNDFVLNKGLSKSVKLLKDSGFIVVILSNQGGVAKGIYSVKDVLKLHEIMQKELSSFETAVNDIFFCPHHESTGKCLCRKPGSLMVEKALAIYKINPSESFMIGDSERDIVAAERAGVKGILIKANESIYEYCRKIVSQI